MRFRRTAAVALAVIALVATACGSSVTPPPGSSDQPSPTIPIPFYSPGPTAPPEPADVAYARIEQQVQDMRMLQAKRAVDPKVLDAQGLARQLRDRFDRDTPTDTLTANERLYKLLRLLPKDASLKDLELQLLTSQVAGFYDPDEKSLFVVSRAGGLGPSEQVTFAHEFTHALQDQNFGLKKLGTDDPDHSDRALARLSIAEGDATLLMTDWAQTNLTPVQLLQMAAEASDPQQIAILNSMPGALRDQLLFPYTTGLAFVQGAYNKGGWQAVDQLYANPPNSTEQLMHPDKYEQNEQPLDVQVPSDLAGRMGTGWKIILQDTLGEFAIRDWLGIAGNLANEQSDAAAAGWGGDRVALLSNGSAYAVQIETSWDSSTDAAEFATAATAALDGAAGESAMIGPDGSQTVAVLIATDKSTLDRLKRALAPSA
jgi:hypothetical protein